MFYTLDGAAQFTGLRGSVVLDAIERGQIAATKDLFGEWQIEGAILERWAPPRAEGGPAGAAPDAANNPSTLEAEIAALVRAAGPALRAGADDSAPDAAP